MTNAASVCQPINSVVEIIAQVRFPSLLAIASTPPAAFQERVRNRYPVFGLSQDRQAYVFQDESRQWMLTLGADSLAVQVRGDAGWEIFKTHLAEPVQAFSEIYRPQYLARVGLRIRHVIRRSAYGLAGQDWRTLLHPHLAATCSWPELGGEVQMSRGEIVVGLTGKPDRLRMGHGVFMVQGPQGENREIAYALDYDLFVESQVSIGDVFSRLDEYYRESQRAFRSCLADRLIQAMVPSAIAAERAA